MSVLIDKRTSLTLEATYVSVDEFDDLNFQLCFDTEHPGTESELSGPMKPYLVIQRQFDDEDGICYIATHEAERYTGRFRLRLIEFTPTRLAFDIDRATDRGVEVTFALDPHYFRELRRIVYYIFGVKPPIELLDNSLSAQIYREAS